MTDTPVSHDELIAQAVSDESTLYFAVPLPATTDNPLPCAYFDTDWNRQELKKPLETINTNRVTFSQQGRWLPEKAIEQLKGVKPLTDLTLYAAVATTLAVDDVPTPPPPSFLQAQGKDGATTVTVPVDPGATRGVLLVFRTPMSGTPTGLISTKDPEIRNGSS